MIKTAEQILAEMGPQPRARMGRPPLHKTCTLPDCTNKHQTAGLCQKHKYALDHWGDPYHVWVRPRSGYIGRRCGCPNHDGRRDRVHQEEVVGE